MKIPITLVALALSGALAPSAMAQQNERVAVIYGDDACPPNKEGEIVVCARKPESERFRIPEPFRKQEIGPAAGNESWAVRAEGLDRAGPHTGVNDCSVVGPAGWTGCFSEWLRTSRAERRAMKRESDSIPGGTTPAKEEEEDE